MDKIFFFLKKRNECINLTRLKKGGSWFQKLKKTEKLINDESKLLTQCEIMWRKMKTTEMQGLIKYKIIGDISR